MDLYKKIFHLFFKNILIILIILFIIWMSFFDENSLSRHMKIKKEVKTQENKIEKYKNENSKSQSTIEMYETDTITPTFKKILREEYGLAKEDEIIFKIE
tara:strand:+ start:554 stop:853 length:300 start_codon:yes stop_codon:yes gene_type:complete